MTLSQGMPVLRDDAIILRSTRPDDIGWVVAIEHRPENAQFIVQWSEHKHRTALTDPDVAHYVIETATQQRTVGYAILRGVARSDGIVELTRLVIAEPGLGFGRRAVRLIMRVVFDEVGAHRFWLDVADYNLRAQRLYASEGFEREGVLRGAVRILDTYVSLVVMSVLAVDYRAARARASGNIGGE